MKRLTVSTVTMIALGSIQLLAVVSSAAFAEDAQALLIEADEQFNQQQFKEAIATASKAIEADNKLSRAFNVRAKAHMGTSDLEAAIDDFTSAIELNESDEESLRGRALAYEFRGDVQKSIDDYTKAIEIDKESAYSYAGRAGVYVLQGKSREANADFKRALEADVDKKERQRLASEIAGRAAIAVMKANNGVASMVRQGIDPGTITREQQGQWDQSLALGLHAADQARIAFAENRYGKKHIEVLSGLVFCIKQFIQAAEECRNELHPRAIDFNTPLQLPGMSDPELASLLWPELAYMRRDMLLDYALTLGFASHDDESKEITRMLLQLIGILGEAGEDAALTAVASKMADLPESFEFPEGFHDKLKKAFVLVGLQVAEQVHNETEQEMEWHNGERFPGEAFANEVTHSSYLVWQREQDEKFNKLLMKRNRSHRLFYQAERRSRLLLPNDEEIARQVAALRKKMNL